MDGSANMQRASETLIEGGGGIGLNWGLGK
jgi:hypothetical protein